MTVTKNPKETFNAPLEQPSGGDSTVSNPLQTEAQNLSAKDPIGTKNIAAGNEVAPPSNVVKVSIDGKDVNAVQTIGSDGKPVLTYNNVEYSLDQKASKAGNQVWVSDDGQTITQSRGRALETPGPGVPADATPTPPVAAEKPTKTPPDGTSDSGVTKTPGGESTTGDLKNTTPDSGTGKEVQPISTMPVSDAKTPPGASIPEADKGGNKGGGDGADGGKEKGKVGDGGESGGNKGGGESGDGGKERGKVGDGGESGGNKGGGESGGNKGDGGGDKGSDRGEGKLSIPEKSQDKPADKPVEKSPDKPADKPAEKPESGSEKSPLDKIDLSTREGRRELFEALKSAREILDGKGDLKTIDPKQRALVEELMKLDQSRSEKLFGLLSQEFQGKGTPMSDSAYMFNLRTLLGLERIASPTQPTQPIPGLSPELARALQGLFKMYTGEQNAQRSTMLGEAYKFAVDYNTSMGLDKNGLTSRDILVALNTLAKDFVDINGKQQPLSALLANKETFAQLAGKDQQTNLTADQIAKLKDLTATSPAELTALAQKLQDSALKTPTQQEVTAKVEGHVLKDLGGIKADALAAHQQAAEQSVTGKVQPNQFGQKDPLTLEQKELAEREQGTKKKPEDDKHLDDAHRLAAEAALAASLGGRASSADIQDGNDDSDEKKRQDDEEARRQYKTKQGDTLEMIAETQLKRKTAATLIFNINSSRIPAKVMGNLHIISMKPDMVLDLPTPNEVKTFKGPYLQFQYREFGSAEEELAFWQKFIAGQDPGHSSLFDKFGMGQGHGPATIAGVDDNFAAEAFTAAQRQNIRAQLGMETKESKENQTTKTVRYGESIKKFTARTLFDESLWELVARKNNLPIVEDKGEKTVRLKSYQKLVLPTATEVKEYKQAASGFAPSAFEMVSRECPKCRRLVRQNESVCPPPCFYAFVETTNQPEADAEPNAQEKVDPQAARLLRRRRTTGFIPERETKPVDETPSAPFENEVISTVLKAAGLSSAAKVETVAPVGKLPISAASEAQSNPSHRGVKVHDFDSFCRVMLTPKDREGRKFERKLEVLKDGTWVTAVLYEIGQQESFVTEFEPSGAPRKQRIDLPFEPAMQLSENHINEAWKEYRQQFLGE